jgi:hypothetical protein
MKKSEEMTSYNSELQVSTLVQECINWSGLSAAQFSTQSGFADATRIYAAVNNNRDLGVTSFNAILRRFPELNGDRFVRKSGPLLLADLCEKQINGNINAPVVARVLTKSEEYYQAVITGKDEKIITLEKEVEFLRGLLTK